VSEIFNVEQWCALENWFKGHWGSLKVALFNRAYRTSYQSAIVSTSFEILDVEDVQQKLNNYYYFLRLKGYFNSEKMCSPVVTAIVFKCHFNCNIVYEFGKYDKSFTICRSPYFINEK